MSIRTCIAAACLIVSGGTLAADIAPQPVPPALPGIWELVAVDGAESRSIPFELTIELSPTGQFKVWIWETGEIIPTTLTSHYRIVGELVEISRPGKAGSDMFRIRWEAGDLVMTEIGEKRKPELRFTKRAWLSR